jgi:ATP-dependent DNA helicase DinG
MDYRELFVKLFTSAAKDKPERKSVQVIDGCWTLTISGNKNAWAEMVQAACVPSLAEQVIDDDTITVRWPSVADQIFGADGILAKALQGYEVRSPQLHMARLVQRGIEMGEPVLVEAGTGTGKSFAYAAVAMAMGKRCVISTSNKALQAQLYQKDIPFLCKLFPGKKVALALGKGNYMCRAKCQDERGNVMISDYATSEWYKTTEDGNTEELDFVAKDIHNYTVDEDCTGKRCPLYAGCFYYQAKAERQAADVIICNHALLILNELYPQANILPSCQVMVVDEAHKLADYARNALGQEFTQKGIGRVVDMARDILGSEAADADHYLQLFWSEVSVYLAGSNDRQVGIKHDQEFEQGQRLATALHELADSIWHPEDTPEDDEAIRRNKKANKVRNMADNIHIMSEPTAPNHVRWIEPKADKLVNVPFDVSAFVGRMAGFETEQPAHIDRTHCARCNRALTADAVHVLDGVAYGPDCIRYVDAFGDAEIMARTDWEGITDEPVTRHKPTSIVFTSATMAVEVGDGKTPALAHFMKECGIDHGLQMVADSPFDYASNALLYIPNGDTPDPNSAQWPAYVLGDLRALVMAAKGGAFLLFTSYSNMNAAVGALQSSFESAGLSVLVQGGGLTKGEIARRFREDGNAVLFATKSFWEGVSIEGAALRLVVIDKMPFQAPSPLLKARETTVNNSFFDLHLPEMVIDLKQGMGRLIRRMDDYGVIALLDSRARLKSYGRKTVVPSLPPAKLTQSRDEVSRFFFERANSLPDLLSKPLDFPVATDDSFWDELDELGF